MGKGTIGKISHRDNLFVAQGFIPGPAGTASLDIRDYLIDGQTVRCGLCRALGVLPQYAGLGIGTLLMQEREKLARALFCRRLYVATHPRNQRAIDLFLRLGYLRPDPDKAAFVKEL